MCYARLCWAYSEQNRQRVYYRGTQSQLEGIYCDLVYKEIITSGIYLEWEGKLGGQGI